MTRLESTPPLQNVPNGTSGLKFALAMVDAFLHLHGDPAMGRVLFGVPDGHILSSFTLLSLPENEYLFGVFSLKALV